MGGGYGGGGGGVCVCVCGGGGGGLCREALKRGQGSHVGMFFLCDDHHKVRKATVFRLFLQHI